MEDFYKDEITALCTVEDDAEEGRSSQTSTPTSGLPPAMAAMSGGMLPDAALGAALGMPFQQVPNANNNLLLSYLQQQQQQQQGNPFLMSLLYQQQQMQQQQQQVRNVLVAKGASERIESSTSTTYRVCIKVTRSSHHASFFICTYRIQFDNICPSFYIVQNQLVQLLLQQLQGGQGQSAAQAQAQQEPMSPQLQGGQANQQALLNLNAALQQQQAQQAAVSAMLDGNNNHGGNNGAGN